MKALPGEHHPRPDELLVEGRHLLEQLLARHLARLALLRRLDQHHDTHPPCLLAVGLLLPLRRASEAKIDTHPKPAAAAATRRARTRASPPTFAITAPTSLHVSWPQEPDSPQLANIRALAPHASSVDIPIVRAAA